LIDDLSLQSQKNQTTALKHAIHLLENGRIKQAEEIITQVLRINKKNRTARLLDRQIKLSAKEIFQTSRITNYTVKAGDSLGSIAKRWLNDSIYFVSLARLNKIDNPAQIKPGQILTLPVLPTSPLATKERQRSQANLELLRNIADNGKWLKAITRMNDIYILKKDENLLISQHQKALDGLASSRVSIDEKRTMISQVEKIAGVSKRTYLNKNFERFNQLQLHSVLMREFKLLYDDKSYYEAADKLISAKNLSPNEKNNTEEKEIEKQLIELLHKDAILLKKNRQLDQALLSWKKILALQPEHELANKYFQRTNKLLERLKSLN
jgi:LysM repeat protein